MILIPSGTFQESTMTPPIISAQILILPSRCWYLKRWWQSHLFITPPLLQPPGKSRLAWDSSVNKTFQKSTFMLSAYFRRFCTCVFVKGGLLISLTCITTFFRKRDRLILKAVIYPMHLKCFPLVKPGLFINSWQKTWENKPLVTLFSLYTYLRSNYYKYIHGLVIYSNYFRYF